MSEKNPGVVFCGDVIPKSRGNDVAPDSSYFDLKLNTPLVAPSAHGTGTHDPST
jgi:hypothetical protein|uniref:Uncharacterized protein n=1 Tax=Zea mays TaxID=4577 RepID=C4J7J1_MAIZE|nr:unknown [Zea mays]